MTPVTASALTTAREDGRAPLAAPSWVAAGVVLAGVAAWVAAVVLDGLGPVATQTAPSDLLWAGSFVGPIVIGGFLAWRRPRNTVGWLLAVGPTLVGAGVAADEYATAALAAAPPWPAAVPVLVVGQAAFAPGVLLLLAAYVAFPDGRLPSPRWRGAAWGVGTVAAVLIGATVLRPQFLAAEGNTVENPIGIDAIALVSPLVDAGYVLCLLVGLVALAASLVIRIRRGGPLVRRQLAWLGYPVGAALLIFAVGAAAEAISRPISDSFAADFPLVVIINVGVPVAIVIAITRHRLYDLDRLVTRTLSYALVTAVLVAVYVLSVVTLRSLLAPVTGDTDLAVAGSTLAVAALFGPVRRRVQAGVDRRFNRRRYDAARAVASFGQRLRDEVDLDEVAGELHAVTVRTVEPASASLWLVPDVSGRS